MNVDFESAFFVTTITATCMAAPGRGGSIIKMGSVHQDRPMPGNTGSCRADAAGAAAMQCSFLDGTCEVEQ